MRMWKCLMNLPVDWRSMFIERRRGYDRAGKVQRQTAENLAKVILYIFTFLRTEIISRVRKEGKGRLDSNQIGIS